MTIFLKHKYCIRKNFERQNKIYNIRVQRCNLHCRVAHISKMAEEEVNKEAAALTTVRILSGNIICSSEL